MASVAVTLGAYDTRRGPGGLPADRQFASVAAASKPVSLSVVVRGSTCVTSPNLNFRSTVDSTVW